MLPHHISSILAKAWDVFKVSYGESHRKTKLPPLVFTNLIMNTQACAASVQVYFGEKFEEINKISCRTSTHIDIEKSILMIL